MNHSAHIADEVLRDAQAGRLSKQVMADLLAPEPRRAFLAECVAIEEKYKSACAPPLGQRKYARTAATSSLAVLTQRRNVDRCRKTGTRRRRVILGLGGRDGACQTSGGVPMDKWTAGNPAAHYRFCFDLTICQPFHLARFSSIEAPSVHLKGGNDEKCKTLAHLQRRGSPDAGAARGAGKRPADHQTGDRAPSSVHGRSRHVQSILRLLPWPTGEGQWTRGNGAQESAGRSDDHRETQRRQVLGDRRRNRHHGHSR